MSESYDINNFNDLFSEIGYAFESKYPPRRYKEAQFEAISFYKLMLRQDGIASYKDDYYTFDPKLWRKVVALYELLVEEPKNG